MHLNTILQINDFGFICEIGGFEAFSLPNAVLIKIIFYTIICSSVLLFQTMIFLSFSCFNPPFSSSLPFLQEPCPIL